MVLAIGHVIIKAQMPAVPVSWDQKKRKNFQGNRTFNWYCKSHWVLHFVGANFFFFTDLWLFLTLFKKNVPACVCKIIREHQNIPYSLSKREQILIIRKCHPLHDLSNRTVFRLIQEQCLEDVIVERGVVLAGPFTVWTEVQLQDLRLHDILTW